MPDASKFSKGDRVQVIAGKHTGKIGTVGYAGQMSTQCDVDFDDKTSGPVKDDHMRLLAPVTSTITGSGAPSGGWIDANSDFAAFSPEELNALGLEVRTFVRRKR